MSDVEGECCGSGCSPCVLDIRAVPEPSRPNCLRPDRYRPFTVSRVERLGSDVMIVSWRCEASECCVQAAPAQHAILRAPRIPPFFSRPYTLVLPSGSGFTLAVRLRANGRMSQHLATLRPGDVSHFRGPFGDFRLPSTTPDRLLLLGAGVGVAPLFSLAAHAVEGEGGVVRLLLSNTSLQLLPLRSELAELACYWNFTRKLFVAVDDAPTWIREDVVIGRIGKAELEAELREGKRTLVAVCGGDKFKQTMVQHLSSFEHSATVHVF